MEALINYFNEIPTSHRSVILFGGLTLFMLIETGIPFVRFKYNRARHLMLNLFFTFTTILVNFVFAFLLIKSSLFATTNEIGISYWLNLNPLWTLILGLLVLDFISAWLAHYASHKVKWLWQFHVIHHSDSYVDATTANRHHPGESVQRFVFTCMAIIVFGAPIWLIMLYQALSAFFSQFNHSNFNLPNWLDQSLMWIFCTPRMHRVHHHYRQPYSDSNYGNIFSLWDRIFQSFKKVDNHKLIYGLDTYPLQEVDTNNAWKLLKIPFEAYRPRIDYPEEENLES